MIHTLYVYICYFVNINVMYLCNNNDHIMHLMCNNIVYNHGIMEYFNLYIVLNVSCPISNATVNFPINQGLQFCACCGHYRGIMQHN